MFDFASNLIRVCCFEVTEDFRSAYSCFSYLLILPFRAEKLWKKLPHPESECVSPAHEGSRCLQTNLHLATAANTDSQLKLSQVKGQFVNCAHRFFSATFHEPSSNRSHWDPRINRLPALTYLATQMLLNTMKYCRLQAVAFQAELLQLGKS